MTSFRSVCWNVIETVTRGGTNPRAGSGHETHDLFGIWVENCMVASTVRIQSSESTMARATAKFPARKLRPDRVIHI
jgi:hypothetical protein